MSKILSLANAEGAPTLKQSETSKLKETIENIPIGKYQDKPTLLVKFEDRSKSGLTRWYNIYYVSDNYELLRLTWDINQVYKEHGNGNRYDRRREAFKVKGCGFSGAHSIVYDIGRMLYADGYALNYREF